MAHALILVFDLPLRRMKTHNRWVSPTYSVNKDSFWCAPKISNLKVSGAQLEFSGIGSGESHA
jgi:hypothetical protein